MISTYGRNFWMLAISMFLFMTSFNLIIPELNGFITNLDGAEQKGLIILLFSVTATLARPISGKLSDTIGRKPVMYIGVVFGGLACLLYPLSTTVFFFLSLRLFHGFAAGFHPTGATAMATDILPADKRGQGMGIWGVFISLGFGVGQSLGSVITNEFGLTNLFMIASGVSLIAGIMLMNVKETLPVEQKVPFKFSLLTFNLNDIFEPTVLPSAIVMLLTATCSGVIFVIVPDLAEYLGIENKGAYFTYYAISTIVVRLFTSSLSDKIGRRKTLILGIALLIIALLLTGLATTETAFIIAATLFGIATGINSPTLMAWMGDLSDIKRRGAGSGTIFIALEIGIMLGSGMTLYTYDNTPNSVFFTFSIVAGIAFLAMLYLIWHLFRRESNT